MPELDDAPSCENSLPLEPENQSKSLPDPIR